MHHGSILGLAPASLLALAALAQAQPDTLRKLAALRGIYVGAAVSSSATIRTAAYDSTLSHSFNGVVAENAMKFSSLTNTNRTAPYNWTTADNIVSFAEARGMKIRGHTFIWHSQAASWFNNLTGAAASRDTTLKIMREHIGAVGGRWKGKIHEWDVVNEGIAQNGGTSPNYRTTSPWYSRIGVDYFDSAFVIAQRTDTAALLFYNDFGGEFMNSKAQNVYDLVKKLKDSGIPIHGVGLQCHFGNTLTDTAAMGQNMRRLAALGLAISLTEIDIQIGTSGTPTAAQLETQKQNYRRIAALCLSIPACKSFYVWGVNDNQSWRTPTASTAPLLFTGTTTITPKPAYWGVVEALEEGSTATSIPSAPWNVVAASGAATGSVVVSWQAPVTDGRTAITGYKVMAVSDTTRTCTTTGALSCTVTGLAPGSSHQFFVRATNSVGSSGVSPYSGPAAAATGNVKLPGAPKNVTASIGSPSTTVVIAWAAPDSDGGGAITAYKAMSVSDTSKSCTTGGALTCSIAGLAPGSYTFIVKAQNAAGFGPASPASAQVTVGILAGRFLIGANFSGTYTFVLPEAAAKLTEELTMTLLDVKGKVVWRRTVNPSRGDSREIAWDGTTLTGARAGAGVYLVRVRTAGGGDAQEAIQRGVRIRAD